MERMALQMFDRLMELKASLKQKVRKSDRKPVTTTDFLSSNSTYRKAKMIKQVLQRTFLSLDSYPRLAPKAVLMQSIICLCIRLMNSQTPWINS